MAQSAEHGGAAQLAWSSVPPDNAAIMESPGFHALPAFHCLIASGLAQVGDLIDEFGVADRLDQVPPNIKHICRLLGQPPPTPCGRTFAVWLYRYVQYPRRCSAAMALGTRLYRFGVGTGRHASPPLCVAVRGSSRTHCPSHTLGSGSRVSCEHGEWAPLRLPSLLIIFTFASATLSTALLVVSKTIACFPSILTFVLLSVSSFTCAKTNPNGYAEPAMSPLGWNLIWRNQWNIVHFIETTLHCRFAELHSLHCETHASRTIAEQLRVLSLSAAW